VSDDWMRTMGGQDESYRGIWSRQDIVPMLTLDNLIEHFEFHISSRLTRPDARRSPVTCETQCE